MGEAAFTLPESGRGTEICHDQCAIRVIRTGEHVRIEVRRRSDSGDEPIAEFVCGAAELAQVADGGHLHLSGGHAHLLLRGSESEIWIVVAAPARRFSESCLVPRERLTAALAAA